MHYADTVSYIQYITTVTCILRQYSIYIQHTNNLTTTIIIITSTTTTTTSTTTTTTTSTTTA